MYFNKVPLIVYPFTIGGKEVLKPMTDITFNIRFRKQILDNISLFDEYDIQEGETPELIAARIYGDPLYHWVIMLVNERYNYIEDFPKTQRSLGEYVNAKYTDPYGVHHYENSEGFNVMQSVPDASPISNYDYEDRLNESKRRIKIVSPNILVAILKDFNTI